MYYKVISKLNFMLNNFLKPNSYNVLRTFATAIKKEKLKYNSVVGLEIHAQISTNSKLFSGAEVAFGAPVNSCVSLVDASIPGTLPVLNKKCVEAGVKTALALGCTINPISMFDRKHYFYADLPAGYQITQQRAPLANKGNILFHVFVPGVTKKAYAKTSKLHQLQLEQDSGKSLHDPESKRSLVDLNRAGIPLMEFVFEPDLSNGEEAAALVKELILILTKLGTCSCKMEEGALRVDANISINKHGEPFGTRTEIKNIGSIRGVADSISYEIKRQMELVEAGGIVHNETRSWDAISGKTIPIRDKEVEQDYRFMPEPNLPPLHLNVTGNEREFQDLIDVCEIKKSLPELPEETRQTLVTKYHFTQEAAVVFMNEAVLLNLFFDVIAINPSVCVRTVTNVLMNDVLMLCNKNKIDISKCEISSTNLAKLLEMLQTETINLNLARLILQEMLVNPSVSPIDIAQQNNWKQIKDFNEITKICKEVLAKNPKMVSQYKKGKEKIFYALLGEIDKLTEHRANMALVVDELKELLKK